MKKLCLFGLFVLHVIMAKAQVTFSPVPQQVEWGDTAITQNTYFDVTGFKTADVDAVRNLKLAIMGRNIKVKGKALNMIYIGEKGDNAVSKWADKIPDHPEGYYLSVANNQVVIAGADESGTFYGVQTFMQLIGSDTTGVVRAVEIADWPDVSERGVVEGFYGNPWSHEDRLRQFRFYGRNKMNTYIYGPKDDPYHRDHWRVPYPDEMGKKLHELVEAAHSNKVKFVWAIHPGLDIKWNHEDSVNIVNKLETVYDLGVRSFAVFFDDISGEGTKAIKQAGLLNYITDEFVRKHDDVEPLIMCPTEYNQGWAKTDYLPILGSMTYPEVRIMWTGAHVVDMIDEEDIEWIMTTLGRKPYIWLNWPVNDYCISHMLMGPTYGNALTISEGVAGFVSNPMEYAEASLISLYSIADYTWHMSTYDSDRSWRDAISYLLPSHAVALQTFCEHNIDLGPNGHKMRRMEESMSLADAIKRSDTEAINAEFSRMFYASKELDTVQGVPLIDEIRPWLEVMKYTALRGAIATSLRMSIEHNNQLAAMSQFRGLIGIDDLQQKVLSRDFPGSIKKPNPQVATLVAEPYIKQIVSDCELAYRAKWGNPDGLFPDAVVADGQYYIVVKGRRLTNVNANPNRYKDHPIFVAYNDTINPQRQMWNIRMDSETGRYSIINAQDGRYLNELGQFWESHANPYETAWHTYIFTEHNGKYSIRNAGLAGDKYWDIKGNRIASSADETAIFELVKVE